MKNLTSTEKNVLIAEFMGMKKDNPTSVWYYDFLTQQYIKDENLSYHTDFNKLLQVILKIENACYNVYICGISCKIYKLFEEKNTIVGLVCGAKEKKHELVFDTIVLFIQYLNENQISI